MGLTGRRGLVLGLEFTYRRMMAIPASDRSFTCDLRQGRMIWHYDARHDVVTLSYKDLVLETEADVAWFLRSCDAWWKHFDAGKPHERKDLLVDMGGIVVKPAVAASWNAARGRLVERYLRRTYRFGGERRTVTAVHLGEVLQKVEGTVYADRAEALAAFLADRGAEHRDAG
jgi:hypothetical protein